MGQHYEENPYPRWSRLPSLPAINTELYLTHDLGYEPEGASAPIDQILIAGCGTGQQPLQLLMLLRDKAIDAMDLSRASLGYAAMMAERYGVGDRLNLFQGDILELPNLDALYDLIQSSGVIHHMEDPAAGLAALTACLRPGGWLRLGLYSETARRHIRTLRDAYGQDQDLADPVTLRQLRQRLLADQSEAAKQVSLIADFYTLSGFRDLLFHRQEHRYTIPMIADMLPAEGLEFMGFSLPNQAVRDQYRASFPDDPNMLSLENWHRFEQANPDTFLAMYNFWCRRPG
ncbi:MAG: class I SAM-dependent methyltransferase [Alphaproteobacteria bacterium]|nr:class I SAM-dependent methyltransferase [Alphaproteobacteria bacterium SS10]